MDSARNTPLARNDPQEQQLVLRFIEEYKMCCEDWRTRDAYVQQKFFNVAIVLFAAVIAVAGAFGTLDDNSSPILWGIYALVFFLLGMYMLIALISTVKDIYYRDGSEILLNRLLDHLPGEDKLHLLLADLKRKKTIVTQQREKGSHENPRKLKASTIASLGVTSAFERFLASRGTYRWIVRFYALVFLCCLAGCGYCVVSMLLLPPIGG